MSKIVTARINMNTTAGQGTFVVPMLTDPGEKRGYRLLSFGITGALTGAGGSDGIVVALQDGEIEPGLLAVTETGRAQRFNNTDGMFDDELSVAWSLAIASTGSGQGYSTEQKNWWPGFITANPLSILFNTIATGFKRILVHLEYEQVSMTLREWVELKHRSPVVDLLWGIDT